jgi:cbb3-type cytochrome oxidase maturation protein
MSVIIILILASLAVALLFLLAFIWAVRSGQYEDTFTPSLRVLAEDPAPAKPTSLSETKSKLK